MRNSIFRKLGKSFQTLLVVLAIVGLNIGTASAVLGNVIINEFQADPVVVDDANGEWIELKNTTPNPIDLTGWTIDDGGSHVFSVANVVAPRVDLSVDAFSFFTLCKDGDIATNGGVVCDYEYAGMSLTNTGDTITLTDPSSTLQDTVTFPAVTAGDSTEILRDSVGTQTLVENSTTPYGTGSDTGTPGAVNAATIAAAVVTNTRTGEVFPTLQDAIDNPYTLDGDTLSITSDIVVTERTNITKELVIDGGGFTIFPTFTKTSNSNNASLAISSDNVTIQSLTIDGVGGTDLHGINVYVSDNVLLDNVTVVDNDRTGVVVNGSSVTVNNIVTSGNGWHGINVDQGGGVTSPAVLTVTGNSLQTDALHIYVDDTSKDVTVIDTLPQYDFSDFGNLRIYMLDVVAPTTPSIITPTSEQYFTSQPILGDWTDSTDTNGIDKYQIEYVYDDGHTFAGGPYRETPGTQSWRNHTPAAWEQGGVTIRVRAYDPAGNISGWSNSVHYYYDSVAPDAFNVSPPDNTFINGASITQEWGSTASDVDYYVYESYNDSAGTSLRWTNTFTTTSKTATSIGEAEYWWRVKAVDMAGNESAWTDLWKITVDNTAPLIEVTEPVVDSYRNDPVTIAGTATDDSGIASVALHIRDDSANLVLGCTSLPGTLGVGDTWSLTINDGGSCNLPDGYYEIAAWAYDNAGNPGWATRSNFYVENVVPTMSNLKMFVSEDGGATYTQENDLVTAGDFVRIEVDAEDVPAGVKDVEFRITKAGGGGYITARVWIDTPVSGDTYQFDFQVPADGEYYDTHAPITELLDGNSVWVRATDNAGNYFNGLTELFTYDNTAPSVPVLTSPIGFTNDNTPLMQWGDSTDDNGVAGYFYRIYYNCADEGDVPGSCSSVYPNTTGLWRPTSEYQAGTTNDGVYFWQVRAQDNAGIQSDWSEFEKVTIDTLTPDKVLGMTIFKGNNTSGDNLGCSGFTNDRWITVDWNGSTDVNFDFYRYMTKSGWNTTLVPSERTGQISDLDGEYKYQVQAIDKAGNTGEYSDWCYVTLDREAPDVDLTAPADGSTVNGTVNIAGSITDLNNHHYWLVVQNSSNSTVTGPGVVYDNDPNISVSLAWDTTAVPDGDYIIKLEARDAADNKDGGSVEWATVTVDNTAPDAFNVSPPDNTFINGASITQEWGSTASDVDYYVYESYNDSAGTSLRWTNTFTTTSKTATNIGEAEYWWRVKAVDMAGNESSWTDLWKITVDNTAPVSSELTSPVDTSFWGTPITITGETTDLNGVDFVNIYYTLSGSGDPYALADVSPVDNTIDDSPFAWTTDWTPPAEGVYDIKASGVDTAGNEESSVYALNVTYDVTAPTTVSAGPDRGSQSTPFVQTGTATDTNSGIYTTVWSQTSGPGSVLSTGETTLTPTFSADTSGTYTVRLTATDNAGNTDFDEFTFTWVIPVVLSSTSTTPTLSQTGAASVDAGTPLPPTGDVLGDTTDPTAETGNTNQVLAQDEGSTADDCYEILSLCWYWWVAIAAGTGLVYYIYRVFKEDEEDEKK